MITETREIHRCEHCKKIYLRKPWCVLHEKRCLKNPINQRPCYWCSGLEKRETTYFEDTYCGETEREVILLYCKRKERFVYPPIANHRGNYFELGDIANEPMPIKCDLQNIF